MKEPQVAEDAFILELRGISKRFGQLWANRDIELCVRPGECHAVVGENGAGKSTLMQVLFGRWKPDHGEIRYKGARRDLGSPRDAVRMGMGMVHQQLLIFPQLTVLDNILVGSRTRKGVFLRRSQARADVSELCRSFSFELPLDVPVLDLSFAQRQQIELVRALYRGAELLILDEPTSLLSPPEVDALLKTLQSLKDRGHTLLFVSHRLSEVFALADRITVLRRGEKVATVETACTSPREVAQLMAELRENKRGRELQHDGAVPPISPAGGRRLELIDVRASSHRNEAPLWDLSLSLGQGEVLGIGGVVGNGQRTLAQVMDGQLGLSSGRLAFDGEDWRGLTVRQRQERGLRHLPANLMEERFCPGFSLWENHLLGRQHEPRFQRRGWLRTTVVRNWTRAELREGNVTFSGVDDSVENLSGGNLQRMGLLRVLDAKAKLVVLEQPGRGLDLRGQEWLRQQVRRLSGGGVSFLVISYDLEELLSLCHRIAILFRGRLAGVGLVDGTPGENWIRWMTGMNA